MLKNMQTNCTHSWLSRALSTRSGALLCLSGIVLLGVALRLTYSYFTLDMTRDSVLYIEQAEALYRGGSPSVLVAPNGIMPPPFYLICGAALMHLGLTAHMALWLVSMAAGIAMPLVGYALARPVLGGRAPALAVALLCAVHPSMVELSGLILRDSLYILLFALVLVCLIRGCLGGHFRFCALCGWFIFIAGMTRIEGLLLYPAAFAALFYYLWFVKKDRRAFAFGAAGLAVGALIACLILWDSSLYLGDFLYKNIIWRLNAYIL